MKVFTPRLLIRSTLLAALFAAGMPAAVRDAKAAGMLNVTTTADILKGFDGQCSLREAVLLANNNGEFPECGTASALQDDMIVLQPNATYTLSAIESELFGAITGDLDIADNPAPTDLFIGVNGAQPATIQAAYLGGGKGRVLEIADNANVELSGVVITGGADENGGGVLNHGALTLNNVEISGNQATKSGGGIFNAPGASLILGLGSDLRANSAKLYGGGVYNSGATLIVEGGSLVRDNSALSGGGILSGDENDQPASLTLRDAALVSGNTAGGLGGGVYNGSGSTMLIENSSVGQNASVLDGGGIYNASQAKLELRRSSLALNTAGSSNEPNARGGGLSNYGTAQIDTSSIRGNKTGQALTSSGGGVYSQGALTIANSALHDNAMGSQAPGGAVDATNSLTVVNSTVSNNGGAYAIAGYNATLAMHNTTLAGNSGGLRLDGNASTLTIARSIVAGNKTAQFDDCAVKGTPSSVGYNIFGAACGAFAANSDEVGVDPKLQPLQYNGGTTKTRALGNGSPARDVIPNAACKQVPHPAQLTDQRGTARPQGAGCDAGAYEQALGFASPAPAPTIAKLHPASAEAGAGDTLVSVIGSHFTGASEARVNGAARVATFEGPTWLVVQLTAADLQKPGTLTLTVYTPAPGGGGSNEAVFTVVGLADPPPPPPVKHTVFTPMVGR